MTLREMPLETIANGLSDERVLRAHYAARNPDVLDASRSDGNRPDPERMTRMEAMGIPYREARIIAGLDPRRRFTTTTTAMTHAMEFEADAFAGEVSMLVLSSKHHGTGKTIAASWLLEKARVPDPGRKWKATERRRFRDIAELVRMGTFGHDDERQEAMRAMVLVVDDLGSEHHDKSGLYYAFISDLLNARYGAPGLTVITTNKSAEDVRALYGERSYDRLRERASWYDIDEPSMRAPFRGSP